MEIFPDVVPGQPVRDSAAFTNAVRRHLRDSMPPGLQTVRRNGQQSVRIPVYAYSNALTAGMPVVFLADQPRCGDAVPVGPCTDPDATWGVMVQSLAAHECGDAIISGVATVAVAGTPDKYVAPDGQGAFVFAASGTALVLWNDTATGTAVVLLGAPAAAGESVATGYNGPFKVEIVVDENNTPTQLKIYDGSAPNAPYAGYVTGLMTEAVPVLKQSFPVASWSDISAYIALDITYDHERSQLNVAVVFLTGITGGNAEHEYVYLADVPYRTYAARQLHYGHVQAGYGRVW